PELMTYLWDLFTPGRTSEARRDPDVSPSVRRPTRIAAGAVHRRHRRPSRRRHDAHVDPVETGGKRHRAPRVPGDAARWHWHAERPRALVPPAHRLLGPRPTPLSRAPQPP